MYNFITNIHIRAKCFCFFKKKDTKVCICAKIKIEILLKNLKKNFIQTQIHFVFRR